MSTPKVRLSNIDRGINVITAFNSYKNRKTNELVLAQQIKNNQHLADMKRQMSVANATQREILNNQIKEIEHKEEQKFYKALSFNANEIVECLEKVSDQMVLNYLMFNYFDKVKNSLMTANDKLDEINDKLFSKQVLDKLNALKIKSDSSLLEYSNNTLSKIDNLIIDLKIQEAKLAEDIVKPNFAEQIIVDKSKNFESKGILIMGIPTLIFLYLFYNSVFIDNSPNYFYLFLLLVFGIPLFLIIKTHISWRNGYDEYKEKQNKKREEAIKEKQLLEKEYETKIQHQQELKESFVLHPAYSAMQEIETSHPTFEIATAEINKLETSFMEKWEIGENAKEVFKIVLLNASSSKLAVTNLIMDITKIDRATATELIEKTPSIIKECETRGDANYIIRKFEKAGAKVEIR